MAELGDGVVKIWDELDRMFAVLELVHFCDEFGGVGYGYLFGDEGGDDWRLDVWEEHKFFEKVCFHF